MTTRKIISLILCLAICMSICANFSLVKAADATLDLLTFTLSDDGEYYKAGAKDTSVSGEIVIPASYDGLPVKHIVIEGFRGCRNITKVTLPDTITRISSYAFWEATSLKEINIPDGVKYIGEGAFYNCKELKEIAIPDTVTHIGKEAFSFSALENAVIPESVIYTDTNNTGGKEPFTAESLFAVCRSLKSVTLPSSITEIGKFAFDKCESLENLVIPETVTKIGQGAFDSCKKYTNIYLPDSVKSINVRAFGDMTTYDFKIGSVSFPAGISFAESPYGTMFKANHIFYRGTQEQFSKDFAIFDDPTELADISYETIHYNCTGKETYTFVKAVESTCSTYGGEIYNCSICGELWGNKYTELKEHTYDVDGTCTECGLGDDELLSFTLNSDGTAYSVAAKDTNIAGEIIIPAYYNDLPVTEIAGSGFRNCENIIKVTLPDTITRIGWYSFREATSLEKINIPNGVKYIGDYAFYKCEPLKEITIPDTVTHIGKGVFGYTALESAVIPESVIYKDTNNNGGDMLFTAEALFEECRSLKSVTLPSTITELGQFAFSWCENLESFTIPEGVTIIRNNVFQGCEKYNAIYIPDSVKSMSVWAFGDMTAYGFKIPSISFPAEISFIGNYPFTNLIKINHIFYRGTQEQFNADFAIFNDPDELADISYETVHFNCTSGENIVLEEVPPSHCLINDSMTYRCSICGISTDKELSLRGPHIYDEDGSCTMCGMGKTNSEDYLKFTRSSDNSFYGVSECDPEASGAIVIPGEYMGLPVKVISASAFKNCSKVTSIIISEGVEIIKPTAFTGASQLKAITLPSTITTIGNDSHRVFPSSLKGVFINDLSAWCNIDFYNSSSNPLQTAGKLYLQGELIEDLVIPEDVKTIKQIAFQHADSIKSVTFNEGIEEIGHAAFSYCQNLTEINIPDIPVKIRSYAFDRCAYYNDTNNWENGTLYIDNHLIECESEEKEFSVKEGTVTIADYAFYSKSNATNIYLETLNLPDSLVRIGDYSFYGAFNLNVINFGSGLKYIGDYAFAATIMLGEVVLNEGLETIGDYAFYDSEFYLLHLPSTYKEFNPTSFFCTEWLEVITCAEDSPYFMAEDNVLFTKDKHTLLLSSYRPGKTGTSTYSVPEETREIEDYAFCLHPNRVSIKLHDNIERIGVDAFADTYNTTSIDKNYVGKYLVYADTADLVVKEGTLGIADDALNGVENLTIPESLKFIGDSLESVYTLDVESISSWFKLELQHPDTEELYLRDIKIKLNGTPLSELTTFSVPWDVTTIEAYRFGDCSGLTRLFIPDTVTKIDDNAFYNFNPKLIICALYGSRGYGYALSNDVYAYHLHHLEEKPGTGTTVDHLYRFIYTTSYNIEDFSDIVKTASMKEVITSGSDCVNGKNIWGTGSVISVYGDLGIQNYTLVVTGDVNGDSVCDVLDITKTGLAVNEQTELSDSYALASDTNGDKQITVEDYSAIVNLALQ